VSLYPAVLFPASPADEAAGWQPGPGGALMIATGWPDSQCSPVERQAVSCSVTGMPFVQAGEVPRPGQVADIGQGLTGIVGHVQVVAQHVDPAQIRAQAFLEPGRVIVAAVAPFQDLCHTRMKRRVRGGQLAGVPGARSAGRPGQPAGDAEPGGGDRGPEGHRPQVPRAGQGNLRDPGGGTGEAGSRT
jgi:hypothetical protein